MDTYGRSMVLKLIHVTKWVQYVSGMSPKYLRFGPGDAIHDGRLFRTQYFGTSRVNIVCRAAIVLSCRHSL